MNLIEKYIDESKYSIKCPYNMAPSYITIHNTGNKASAKNEVSYMQGNNSSTGFHIAVDDVEAIIAIPLDRNAWHAGDGNGEGNRKSIGIEICYSTGDAEKFKKAELHAVEVVVYLMQKYNIPLWNVRTHKSWSGKKCPHKTDMAWFLSQVESKTNSSTTIDQDLSQAVSAIIKRGINIDYNSWKRRELIKLANVKYLLEKLGGIDSLVQQGIISSPDIWKNGTYTVDNVASLLIKYSKK